MKRFNVFGVTVIELLVVMSAITLLLAVGVPRVEDFAVRARVSEGLAVAAAAKLAMLETCNTSPGTVIVKPGDAGVIFTPTKYVSELIMSADCAKHRFWVGVITRNTGGYPDPYVSFVVVPTRNDGRAGWVCTLIRGKAEHVPSDCRSNDG